MYINSPEGPSSCQGFGNMRSLRSLPNPKIVCGSMKNFLVMVWGTSRWSCLSRLDQMTFQSLFHPQPFWLHDLLLSTFKAISCEEWFYQCQERLKLWGTGRGPAQGCTQSSPSPCPTFIPPGWCVLCSDAFIVMGLLEIKEFNLPEPSEVVGMLLETAVLSSSFGKRWFFNSLYYNCT